MTWRCTARRDWPPTNIRGRWRSCPTCPRRRVGRSSVGNFVPARKTASKANGRQVAAVPRTTDGTEAPVPQRLLAAATRLFAEQGYDRTSVQEIVEAAGV